MESLPIDCVSSILSYTSPLDACKTSTVSTFFKHAAESDGVWERLLPSNYHDIVSSSVNPLKFSSKKELYLQLCMPTLIDNGSKIFKLEKWSGKKEYMLSARELSITCSSDPMYWCWKPFPDSRFHEAVELRQICWLEIQGKITTQMLSPSTAYGAYLIIKITDRAYGLDVLPSKVSIEKGSDISSSAAYLCPQDYKKKQMECLFYVNRIQMLRKLVNAGDGRVPREREDGWMEIELGEFFSGECDEEVKMSLMETKGYHLKAGLIVEGIEVRAKH